MAAALRIPGSETPRAEARLAAMVLDLTAMANAVDAPTEALRRALEAVCDHTDWAVGHAWERDTSGALRSTGLWHLDDPARASPLRDATLELDLSDGLGPIDDLVAEGEVAWIDDLSGDRRLRRGGAARACGLRSGCWVPVTARGAVVAVLEFVTDGSHRPAEDLLGALAFVGAQLGRVFARSAVNVAAAEALAEAMQASRVGAALVAMMAREAQSPIGALVAAAGAHEGPRGAAATQSARLSRMLHGTMDLARLAAGGVAQEPAQVNVGALLAELLCEHRSQAEARGIELRWRNDAPGARCHANAYCLRRALRELFDNALRFTPGGAITLRLWRDGASLMVELRDTGRGMGPAFLPRALEPFTQEHRDDEASRDGAGLGLALARAWLQVVGATLRLQSHPGEGTTVWVCLPALDGDREGAQKSHESIVISGTYNIITAK
ncbi:MAG: GAF domain-containing sensor histidine kinase [Deltaproteobacteria bacterium]|nr:GAF domain-containing sensor histidine kinase [Deltaproteobacteria bacterium]